MRITYSAVGVCLLAACVACGTNDEGPALETQTITPPQATAIPERVQGCLHAGEASGTFVLTASASDTKMDAATYQLIGTADTLREHVGKRVEVSGTIVAEQTAQSRGASAPAEDRARGTSGTPTVQASTELEVKRLQVSGVTPVAGDCEADKSGR